jgi:hypothetical protein
VPLPSGEVHQLAALHCQRTTQLTPPRPDAPTGKVISSIAVSLRMCTGGAERLGQTRLVDRVAVSRWRHFEPATGLFNLPHSHSAFEAGTLRLTADLRRTGLSMVTIHRWTQAMRCPHCENEGTTALAQSEVPFDVTVECISKGFEAVQSQYGVNYRCVPCGILVRK